MTGEATGPRLRYLLVVALLTVLGVARLAPTYTTFTQIVDEPAHIISGLEWLDRGTYSYELKHPPLARVAVAVGPYLRGIHLPPQSSLGQGNAVLNAEGRYWETLTLARLGTLPFLVLACVVIGLWARRWFDEATGLWALLLFICLPPILGHAGLATLDMACAASVTLALYQLVRWLESPAWPRSVGLGLALGLAFLSKMSSVPFVAACLAVAISYIAWSRREDPPARHALRSFAGPATLAILVAALLVWAGYRFHLSPIWARPDTTVERLLGGQPALRRLAYAIITRPLPLADLVIGLQQVYQHNQVGHSGYLFGEVRRFGWWYFFPVVIALKTPLGFLVLAIAGLGLMMWPLRTAPRTKCFTAVFPLTILLVAMTSRINIGIRHVLPVFPLLALAAGHAVSSVLAKPRTNLTSRALALGTLLLVASVVADSLYAHPDYLAYFNQLAGTHPERIRSDSDLDWGQDLDRLSQRLHALGVDRVAIRYFGTASLETAGLPRYTVLTPDAHVTGYVAISLHRLVTENARSGRYEWLARRRPLERIGKSILLFRIDG